MPTPYLTIERGGSEELTQVYNEYVEESDADTRKRVPGSYVDEGGVGMRISATSRTLTLCSAFSSFTPSSNIVRQ